MGKMIYLLVTVIAVQFVLIFTGASEIPGSSLWDIFINPAEWNKLSLLSLMQDSMLIIGAGALIGGLIIKNDLMVFSGLSGVLFTFGISLYNLWQQIAKEPSFGGAGETIASFIVGPLVFLYIFTVIEWWRGRD